jgi:RNA polymerase sigma-70 factor (ECF subfamily)
VARYQNAVFAVALARLGSRADAEDVVQETFVAAMRALHTLQEPRRVGSWLCGIARHKALDLVERRRRPWTVSWDHAAVGTPRAPQAADVVDTIARAEIRVMVRSAIARLSPAQREAVVLHYLAGYALVEVAQLLGIPLGTVKRRLHDARQTLKEDLWAMATSELGQSTPSADLAARIREALEAARSAQHGDLHREALDHCDLALKLIAALPPGRARTELQRDVLSVKARAVQFPLGLKEAIAIDEEVLGLLETLGNQRLVAQHISFLAGQYHNANDKPKAAAAYHRALDLFREVGDEAGQGDTLLGLGHLHLPEAPSEALECCEQALPLLRRGLRRDAEAVCQADIQILRRLGERVSASTLKVYNAVCDILESGVDGVRFAGQPGFGFSNLDHRTEAQFAIDILQSASQEKLLVGAHWRAGDAWCHPAFSYTLHPLHLTATVVADDEAVTVPAGTFADCLHIRLDIAPDPEDDGSERNRRLNRINCGQKHMWYARGVGLLRFTFDRADGVLADVQLTAYRVAAGDDTHLPLAAGNVWEYRTMGFDRDYVQQNVYEVLATESDRHYLMHWAYAHMTSSEQG